MSTIRNTPLPGALKRESVKKNVAAIHVSGKLTLLQRKLSNVLLLNAYDTLISAAQHRIDARTLCVMIGYNSNDIDTLKTALRGLAETVAEWDMLDDQGHQEWGISSLLSYAKLKNGVCEYAYSPALAEKLHDPKVFALINLNIQRQFTGGHALALYENCFRFVRTGSTGWWELDVFRRLMGVHDSEYYQTYKHLNAKIIKPAVAEINKVSDIIVTPEIRKQGRAVSHIRFLIERNPQLAIMNIDDGEAVRRSSTYHRLVDLGVSDRLARQWLAEHGEDYVKQKMVYVSEQTDVQNPARYLSAAIKGDFAAKPNDALPSQPSGQVSERAAKLGIIRELVDQRSPTQRDADKRLFLSFVKTAEARADFERHGWMSALNFDTIVSFWTELMPDAFE